MGRLMQIALALLIAWTISAQPSMAQRRRHAFGKNKDRAQIAVRVRSDDRVFVREPRRRVLRGFATRSARPQGWDRGRKVGWGNCRLPPGQAKKYGGPQVVAPRTETPGRSRAQAQVLRLCSPNTQDSSFLS